MQRSKSTSSSSFYLDIEKEPLHNQRRPTKSNRIDNIIFILACCCIFTFIVFINYSNNLVNDKPENSNIQQDKIISLSSSPSLSNPQVSMQRNTDPELFIMNDVLSSKDQIIDVVPLSSTDLPTQYSNQKELVSKAEVEVEQVQDLSSDLKEIFSISPIILLSFKDGKVSNDHLETILMNLNINPEPKIINLKKHPNYENILDYLKTLKDESELDIDSENYENFLPRLFMGGSPIGTMNEIVEKFNKNELVSYLKFKGQGLIKIE